MDDTDFEEYKTSQHPASDAYRDRFCCNIEFIQDLVFKTAKLTGYTPPMSEVDLEDWTNLYHDHIKNLDTDAIVKKYGVKFYEPVNGLMEITVCY